MQHEHFHGEIKILSNTFTQLQLQTFAMLIIRLFMAQHETRLIDVLQESVLPDPYTFWRRLCGPVYPQDMERQKYPHLQIMDRLVCLSCYLSHPAKIVTDYSTDAFLAVYKRFIYRRGICATLNSDCGTNFKRAVKELEILFSQSSSELRDITSLIANDETKWELSTVLIQIEAILNSMPL